MWAVVLYWPNLFGKIKVGLKDKMGQIVRYRYRKKNDGPAAYRLSICIRPISGKYIEKVAQLIIQLLIIYLKQHKNYQECVIHGEVKTLESYSGLWHGVGVTQEANVFPLDRHLYHVYYVGFLNVIKCLGKKVIINKI